MPAKIFGPRKQSTRQHIIADQSVHFVEGFILDEGHTAERFFRDYGYDLAMTTFDDLGYVEPFRVYFQVKAAETLKAVGGRYVYDLDIRDFNLWLYEKLPVILVLYDATQRRGYWQDVQRYFLDDQRTLPKKGAKWVRVPVPQGQLLSRDAIAEMRRRKNQGAL